ncbi:MAG: bifunctional 5,10-methylenetetrahydrofolate dehydrogenase/5,10-methenyltetrahydrofolate cyclohydrolase [Anaerovoracaceae bacterium]|jgi:methylenetetrahydrofolate dehydrogenase (NADP+)/methenyltetrahydrofolate cyclohydrolase
MLLKGKPVADQIKKEIIAAVEQCKKEGKNLPQLAIIRVGDRADDIAYEARVLKNCNEVGIETKVVEVDHNVDTVNLINIVNQLNNDTEVHGILIFRPLPAHLDSDAICNTISPLKDIDCMNPINMQKVFQGDSSGIAPCTPEAVVEILKYYDYDLKGKKIAIVNRSMVLGKPLSMLLLSENATVTICHSKTKNLEKVTADADIVVSGVGKAKYFGTEYFTKDSTVIDVGINFEDNKMCGDVDFERVSQCVAAITPVPGGVGTVTSMILLKHVIQAMNMQNE